jgi:hypothetical protein
MATMKIGSNLILILVVIILGCALYLLDERLAHQQTERVKIERVFDITTEPITVAAFETPDQRIAFIRKGESWFLQAPVRARANGPQVERIVAALETLRRQDTITPEQRTQRGLSLADYGLQDSTRRLSVETANGRAEILLIGGETPFGNTVYGRLDRSDVVFTLPDSVLDLFPQDLSTLRDRTLLYGNPANTERIDIHRRGAGFLQLARQKSEWVIQQPLAAKADPVAVRNLLDELFALRVDSFHWDAAPEREGNEANTANQEMNRLGQFEAAGLAEDAARLRITIWSEDDRLGQDLLIGASVKGTENQSFARRGGVDAIYTLSSDIIATCTQPVSHFRSRNIFSFPADDIGFIRLRYGDDLLELARSDNRNGDAPDWQLVSPLHAPANPEAIRSLISHITELKIKHFLDHEQHPDQTVSEFPFLQITLANNAPANNNDIDKASTTLSIYASTNNTHTAIINSRPEDRFTPRFGSNQSSIAITYVALVFSASPYA